MNDLRLTYSPYNLQLKNPFHTSKTIIKNRKGFIVRISETEGFAGTGDVCPFPEFGSESLSDVENAMSDFNLKLKIEKKNIEESIFDCLKGYDKLPAFRHGLEQAILNLLCNKYNVSLRELLNLSLKKKINVNAAIGFMEVEESAIAAETFVKKGFKTLKIKAGRENFEDDYSIIKSIRSRVDNYIKIRIDPNGNWNLNDAITNLKKLDDLDIEYAEQPVNIAEEYIELKNHCNTPLAPDESIRSVKDAKQFIDSGAVSYIILKPMLIGGLLPTIEITRYAEENSVTPVITTSFESAIGKTNAVTAAACVTSDVAHGLGVSNFFTNDLVKDPYQTKSGTIII